jgi:hypothetical protein
LRPEALDALRTPGFNFSLVCVRPTPWGLSSRRAK